MRLVVDGFSLCNYKKNVFLKFRQMGFFNLLSLRLVNSPKLDFSMDFPYFKLPSKKSVKRIKGKVNQGAVKGNVIGCLCML